MVILASQSPRRRELLGYLIDRFEVRPAHCDETPTAQDPAGQALEIAVRKARAAGSLAAPEDWIIAADTLVALDGEIFGKPRDAHDARRMLALLSGRVCTVYTGVAVGHGGQSFSLCEQTDVAFYPLSDKEIEAYIQTGEPFDKAGAFGAQKRGALLIRAVYGDFYTVMGLPVGALGRLLVRLGVID